MRTILFLVLVSGSVILSYIPFLHWPFTWLETFFHEISHGLVAVLTGGSIERIELNYRGSGVCYYIGGLRWLVAFSGYAGAVMWGYFIYISSTEIDMKTHWIAWIIVALLATSIILWCRDLETFFIMLSMSALLYYLPIFSHHKISHIAVQFIGIYVIVSAAGSPLHLLDAHHIGDGAELANLTNIPELFWIAVWETFALWILWRLWRATLRYNKEPIESIQ